MKSLGVQTLVRFDRVVNMAHRDRDEVIAKYYVGSVPCVGEVVNVNGEPYYVVERGWAFGDDGAFAYLRVFGYKREGDV